METFLGVFAHPNKEQHELSRQKTDKFYDSVLDCLHLMEDPDCHGDSDLQWIRQSLFGTCLASTVDRSYWLDKHIQMLDRVRHCTHGSRCMSAIYCQDCLADWRYRYASRIMDWHHKDPKLRLILQQKYILVPRGVYTPYGMKSKRLLLNRYINPVQELPVGTKWNPEVISRVVEDYRLKEFRNDVDATSDAYTDVLSDVWRLIGGMGTITSPEFLDRFNNSDFKTQKSMIERANKAAKELSRRCTNGVSDWENNPLIAELCSHARRIAKKIQDTEGYIQRIIVVPSMYNDAVIMLRLDSMFMARRDLFNKIKAEDTTGLLETQKKYTKIPWRNNPNCVWSFLTKETTAVRKVPDDMHKLLAILEDRFPFEGNRFTKFLPEEFPFYMNCFRHYSMTRQAGAFRGFT